MLAARDDDGNAFSDDEIFDQVITLLVAGHETTATALIWAFFHVLADEALTARVTEAATEAGPSAHGLAADALLGAVCKETLRLTPIIPEVPRLIMADFVAGGVRFEKGKRLMVAVPALHRRADVFEAPDRFVPERFEQRRYAPWEYAPFGGGVRKCLGWAFALQQMAIILGTVFAQFDLALLNGEEPAPGRRNLSVGPRGGVKVHVIGARS